MRAVSNIDASIIKSLCSKGYSLKYICRKSGFSHTTVKAYTQGESSNTRDISKCGRPKILSSAEEKLLVRKIELGIWKTAREAADQLSREIGKKVGRLTIARILKKNGLKSYANPKKPRLLKIHKKQRRVFARLAKKNPIEHWKHVIFTDESRISLFGPDGNKRAWRRSGAQLLDHHIIPTVKFGGKYAMVWGAITYNGVGKLVFINTKMNSRVYINVFETGYLKTSNEYNKITENTVLQHDNDPKHFSAETMRWISGHNINVMMWPGYSPDLNIIENVWYYIKIRVSNADPKPQNEQQLRDLIERIWYSIPLDYIRGLYDSVGARLDQVN